MERNINGFVVPKSIKGDIFINAVKNGFLNKKNTDISCLYKCNTAQSIRKFMEENTKIKPKISETPKIIREPTSKEITDTMNEEHHRKVMEFTDRPPTPEEQAKMDKWRKEFNEQEKIYKKYGTNYKDTHLKEWDKARKKAGLSTIFPEKQSKK